MQKICNIISILLLIFLIQGATALKVVSTTSVLWDPIQFIGGEKVQVIYIADPTICPHMQSDIIPNRIQLQRNFIANADLFIAHNGSVDKSYVMPYVEDFMQANKYGVVQWKVLRNPSMIWNTPQGAKNLSREVAEWLIEADPVNRTFYEGRLQAYLAEIDRADLTPEEKARIQGQQVIVMVWQKEAAEGWLGLNVVNVFAPEFYQQGKFVPKAVVNEIWNNTDTYRDVKYVIENMQSGEMAKGIEEALRDNKINAKRVIFTNFPKSIPGVDSLPDVIRYNKALVTPTQPEATPASATHSTPFSVLLVPIALASFILFAARSGR